MRPSPTNAAWIEYAIACLARFLIGIGLALPTSLSLAAERVTLQLKWQHQFQFAGYYAALEQGYYRDNGLDVALVEATPQTDVVDEVTAQRAQYGVGTSALLLERSHGKPVVVLAAIFQRLLFAFKGCLFFQPL